MAGGRSEAQAGPGAGRGRRRVPGRGSGGRPQGGGRQGPSRHLPGAETKPHSGCGEGDRGALRGRERTSGPAGGGQRRLDSREARGGRGGREEAAGQPALTERLEVLDSGHAILV